MVHKVLTRALLIFYLSLTLSACSSSEEVVNGSPRQTRSFNLYQTPTATATPTPPDAATTTPLPSPTPTLRTHTVRAGEDLGGIAFRYRVSLQALRELNPDVNVYSMSVGTVLLIPHSTEEPPDQIPSPTPVVLSLSPVNCRVTQEGGLWCFMLAINDRETAVESVAAVVRLADENAENVISQVAVAPLDLLSPGDSLPLAVYFSPPLPSPYQVTAELLTALPLLNAGERYLAVVVDDITTQIDEDGLSATVRGALVIEGDEAAQVRVAAAALDEAGEVVGIRRWERAEPLSSEQPLEFQFTIYSAGGKIVSVDVIAEARP